MISSRTPAGRRADVILLKLRASQKDTEREIRRIFLCCHQEIVVSISIIMRVSATPSSSIRLLSSLSLFVVVVDNDNRGVCCTAADVDDVHVQTRNLDHVMQAERAGKKGRDAVGFSPFLLFSILFKFGGRISCS
jgi:hypothetical protein